MNCFSHRFGGSEKSRSYSIGRLGTTIIGSREMTWEGIVGDGSGRAWVYHQTHSTSGHEMHENSIQCVVKIARVQIEGARSMPWEMVGISLLVISIIGERSWHWFKSKIKPSFFSVRLKASALHKHVIMAKADLYTTLTTNALKQIEDTTCFRE